MISRTCFDEKQVAIFRCSDPTYPREAPFHPHQKYPEYPFSVLGSERNLPYECVRGCFQLLGLDAKNYGGPSWNPLGEAVRPGDIVLIKPNLIAEGRHFYDEDWKSILTHGSIIRAVADYVCIAFKGKGKIVVADGPQTDSSFASIVDVLGLREVEKFYSEKGIDFQLTDLRQQEWKTTGDVVYQRHKLAGDPRGYVTFNLGNKSEFSDHRSRGKYYGADYSLSDINSHHNGAKNEYLIAGTPIGCDVLINIPKLKTHCKTGITASLKNLVGVTGDKNWLPHFTMGTPKDGGDQFPDSTVVNSLETKALDVLYWMSLNIPVLGTFLHRTIRKVAKRVFADSGIHAGNWYGNDTVWRMVLDLNKIVLYGDLKGNMRADSLGNRKTYLSIVDGIIGGEGNGPINVDPVKSGVIVCGFNPVSVDAVCATIMGFNPNLIPTLREAFKMKRYPLVDWDLEDLRCISNKTKWNNLLGAISDCLDFRPAPGWVGHIEKESSLKDE